MSDEHPLASNTEIEVEQLANERLLFTEYKNAPVFNPWLVELLNTSGSQSKFSFLPCRATELLISVGLGYGVSIFPHAVRRIAPASVCTIPIKNVPTYTIHAAYHDSIANNARDALILSLKRMDSESL